MNRGSRESGAAENRGHALRSDLHLARMDKKPRDRVARTKRFWFPTDNTSGPGGMSFGGGLQ
jgi:hypothetical protein